ncbi:FixH family protein [Sphingobacterium sp.]|uniref:FixH family protein n=1 Tax=Sphingobacterium sp. TaxID=341027 RepID=UPI0028A0FC86|nr:FixH family protein [Sphingobacterium sp.]
MRDLYIKSAAFYILIICLFLTSCTKEKTDYEAERGNAVEENPEFKEVSSSVSSGYNIRIEALGGVLYRGYNDIRVIINKQQTNEPVEVSSVGFRPIQTDAQGVKISCPHQSVLDYTLDGRYFSGYSVFMNTSSEATTFSLEINFKIGDQTFSAIQNVSVKPQTNKNLNMTTFTGKDNEQYIIALISPRKPNVSENKLVAGIYKLDVAQLSYSAVKGYVLQLDPRMPEPSMGNHSSPNNKDLVQQAGGSYQGVVNYTMTGNWTLNFILVNQNGRVIAGTEVPKDFTPGVEGRKSELYIDILF